MENRIILSYTELGIWSLGLFRSHHLERSCLPVKVTGQEKKGCRGRGRERKRDTHRETHQFC